MPWKTVADDKVRHVWKYKDTGEELTVGPEWYENNGTPYDGNEDTDLEYVRTEILEGDL